MLLAGTLFHFFDIVPIFIRIDCSCGIGFQNQAEQVALLGGLSEIWELDWDTTANDIINSVMEHFSASHPDREVEIE